MSIFKDYNDLVAQRIKIAGDFDYEKDPVILGTIELMTKNIEETIAFLDNDCTEEQFIIDALVRVSKKYPKATEKYNIDYFINSAAEYTD